jgi:glutamate synthase domain-containing protein 1/glutamate synthase domain-containing protein 3
MKHLPPLLHTRTYLPRPETFPYACEDAAEGGCGVIGIACSEQIPGRHLLQSLAQMSNRGNGKGGGIAAVGLDPAQWGVTPEILQNDYLLAIAYLEPECHAEVEQKYIHPTFEIDLVRQQPHLADYSHLHGLEVRPPEVIQYFVRPRLEASQIFRHQHPDTANLPLRQIEDEIVYQNTYRLNREFYASTGRTRAFVLSHAKNLLVLKMVGYGDDVVRYYQLEDIRAHIWIGHHRYPTKGRVWHPGGAHPFIGQNEALVHNGDFANYASICEYLQQRGIFPLFLTDTEVSVLVFDLLYRMYGYPLEYVIESLAPTTERDFALLPPDKQRIYEALQTVHIHSSPDGPWFFLIAQSDRDHQERPVYRLTGITDTSMLRPQVFALQQAGEDGPSVGFAASEKQAIDAALVSLAAEDARFWRRADRYWNARGGSYTDGGAFIFSVYPERTRPARLACTDKFGRTVTIDTSRSSSTSPVVGAVATAQDPQTPRFGSYAEVEKSLKTLLASATDDASRLQAFSELTNLLDRRIPAGNLRHSVLLSLYDQALEALASKIGATPSAGFAFSAANSLWQQEALPDQHLVLDASGFASEGDRSAAAEIVRLVKLGFKRFSVMNCRGHRFLGSGLGPNTHGIRMDVYGSAGDYLASGIDGLEMYVHNHAQDQLAQIMKSGKLVVYGDVGQTFGYAAKGGRAFILGNAAGRPMINAAGRPRIVINGTCLDYLAESFMAGDPHNEGGFIILNGVHLTDDGVLEGLESPYPGGNLFSLASGGAIFVRDPRHTITPDQLNGGEFAPMVDADWELILPYLQENEGLFGITVADLLRVEGETCHPTQVYRKIIPASVRALQAEEAWVRKQGYWHYR